MEGKKVSIWLPGLTLFSWLKMVNLGSYLPSFWSWWWKKRNRSPKSGHMIAKACNSLVTLYSSSTKSDHRTTHTFPAAHPLFGLMFHFQDFSSTKHQLLTLTLELLKFSVLIHKKSTGKAEKLSSHMVIFCLSYFTVVPQFVNLCISPLFTGKKDHC